MSETTFRAVVAAVLVGFLILAIVAIVALAPKSTKPTPSGSVAVTTSPGPTESVVATPSESAALTPIPGPAFLAPEMVGVGPVARGATSPSVLVLRLTEASAAAIPDAPGSFRVTLTDAAGGSTLALVGSPKVVAPGSLGATATLTGTSVLTVTIQASDTVHVEQLTISGLGIRASSTAAVGPIQAAFEGFEGSLLPGTADEAPLIVGSVTAGP